MKNYRRPYPLFSLCGLNCSLCPIHHMEKGCPGCGGGEGHQPCPVIKCSQQHGNIEYCHMCSEYPCERFNTATDSDSFITHRNKQKDLEKAKTCGIGAYQSELVEKTDILMKLLKLYNSGKQKTFFCLAVNLLELQDIKSVMKQIADETHAEATIQEKATLAVNLFREMAASREITLKLKKKNK